MDPVIFFFVLGVFAGFAKADLRFPPAIYDYGDYAIILYESDVRVPRPDKF